MLPLNALRHDDDDDAGFIDPSSANVGKYDAESSWSKEVFSSVGSHSDDEPCSVTSTTLPASRDDWNSNVREEPTVTINPGYESDDEGNDASSRSSLDEQAEPGELDTCSKAQSSVAEAIDLSDTEQLAESAGNVDRSAEQPQHRHYVTDAGVEIGPEYFRPGTPRWEQEETAADDLSAEVETGPDETQLEEHETAYDIDAEVKIGSETREDRPQLQQQETVHDLVAEVERGLNKTHEDTPQFEKQETAHDLDTAAHIGREMLDYGVTVDAIADGQLDFDTSDSLPPQDITSDIGNFSDAADSTAEKQSTSSLPERADIPPTEPSLERSHAVTEREVLQMFDANLDDLEDNWPSPDDADSLRTGTDVVNNITEVKKEDLRNKDDIPPTQPSSHAITETEVLREFDAFLDDLEDNFPSPDDADGLHTGTAVVDDGTAMLKKNLRSKDDNDARHIVGITADVNDAETIQAETMDQSLYSSVMEVPVKNIIHKDADSGSRDVEAAGQLGDADQPSQVDNFEDQISAMISERPYQDCNTTREGGELKETSAAAGLEGNVDQQDLVADSISEMPPFPSADVTVDKTYDDVALSKESEVLTTVAALNLDDDDDVEIADAEVDAIFSGGSLVGQHLCRIRRVSADDADLGQTSDTEDFATSCNADSPDTSDAAEVKLEANNEDNTTTDINQNETREADRMNLAAPLGCTHPVAASTELQAERNREVEAKSGDEDMQLNPPPVDSEYIVDECDSESGRTTPYSELETSLPAKAPSLKIREVLWNDDDESTMETANSEVDVKSRSGEEGGEDEDQGGAAATTISSPGSDLSWRSCTSAFCELDRNMAEDQTTIETSKSVPTLRGVTSSQIAAYRKLCADRQNLAASVITDCSRDTSQKGSTDDDDDDENAQFPFVDTVNTLPTEDFDSRAHRMIPECHDSDSSGEDCFEQPEIWVQEQSKSSVKEDERMVRGADGDMDEVCECSQDVADSCVNEETADVNLA